MNPFVKYDVSLFDMNTACFDNALAEYFRRHEADVMNEIFTLWMWQTMPWFCVMRTRTWLKFSAPGSRKLFWKWGAPQSFNTIDIKEHYPSIAN